MYTDAQLGLLRLAAKLHQGHVTGSRDIQNGRILSGQTSYSRPYDPASSICAHLFYPPLELKTCGCLMSSKAVLEHTMKAYGKVWVQLLSLFLNFALDV